MGRCLLALRPIDAPQAEPLARAPGIDRVSVQLKAKDAVAVSRANLNVAPTRGFARGSGVLLSSSGFSHHGNPQHGGRRAPGVGTLSRSSRDRRIGHTARNARKGGPKMTEARERLTARGDEMPWGKLRKYFAPWVEFEGNRATAS